MGVGGGFIMVPAMIYLLRMPTSVVVGTSLFQIIFLTAATTVLHASQNQTVDVALAVLLMAGGVVGAQFGAVAGERLKAEHLRFLLAALVLLVGLRFAWQLVAPPGDVYSIGAADRRRLMRRPGAAVAAGRVAALGIGLVALAAIEAQAPRRQKADAALRRQGGAALPRRARSSASSSRAPRKSVQADVSARNVAVTSSFNGTEIVIFGAVDNSQQPSAESGLLRRADRGGGRARPPRRAAQEQRGRPLAQHLIGHLRPGAELLRHGLDPAARRDHDRGIPQPARSSASTSCVSRPRSDRPRRSRPRTSRSSARPSSASSRSRAST